MPFFFFPCHILLFVFFSSIVAFACFADEVIHKPTKVINPFTMMSSLSKTYPPKIVLDEVLKKKHIAGEIKQIKGTSLSLTCRLLANKPNEYRPSNGP